MLSVDSANEIIDWLTESAKAAADTLASVKKRPIAADASVLDEQIAAADAAAADQVRVRAETELVASRTLLAATIGAVSMELKPAWLLLVLR